MHSSITKTSKLTMEKYYELQTFSNLTIFSSNALFRSILQCSILRCIYCCFNSHISLWLNLNISPYVLGLFYLLFCLNCLFMSFQNFLWRFDSLLLNVWVLYKLGIESSIIYVANIFSPFDFIFGILCHMKFQFLCGPT